jgi:hypothetical protein
VIRPRLRTVREHAYWDGLTPSERAAFLVGQLVGSGAGVPEPRLVLHLRAQLGDPDVRLCSSCQHPFELPHVRGHPPTRCPTCRGIAA